MTVQRKWLFGEQALRGAILHSDDMADACVFLMSLPDHQFDAIVRSETQAPLFNVGCGEDLTIAELAETIRQLVGFRGKLTYDRSKPDGTPQKLLDVSRIGELGWKAHIPLRAGLEAVYQQFLVEN